MTDEPKTPYDAATLAAMIRDLAADARLLRDDREGGGRGPGDLLRRIARLEDQLRAHPYGNLGHWVVNLRRQVEAFDRPAEGAPALDERTWPFAEPAAAV